MPPTEKITAKISSDTRMLQDHEFFARLCEKRGVSPTPEISDAIRVSSTTGELRLSCLSIMIPVCEIIAQILASSPTIKMIDLSDCLLLSRGLASILNALCEGTAVTSLNLRGNNIKGPTVAQLGKVLACNNTLKRLHIDWNDIGSDLDSFATFCDGLVKNHNVKQLDLRYNQLPPHCAEHLCRIIRGNKCLKSIDLSWNMLGLQGGLLLLSALRENKTITELLLHGNCRSDDTALAIEKRLRENRSMLATTELVSYADAETIKYPTRTVKSFVASTMEDEMFLGSVRIQENKLSTLREREKVEEQIPQVSANIMEINDRINLSVERKSEVNTEFKDDNKIDSNVCANISSRYREDRAIETDAKIADLNKMLQERTAAIDQLTNEIATKVAEVDDKRAQLNLLQTQIRQLREDKEKLDSDKAREIAELRRSHNEAEENWRKNYKELKSSYNECSRSKKEAESKVRRYEREIHKGSLEIDLLRDKLVCTTRACEDVLSKNKTEMHCLKTESKERDNKHRFEFDLLKSTLKETTQALEDCQTELQRSRNESRDLYKNEALLKTKLDDAEHKLLRYRKLEESYQKIEDEKHILEEKLSDSQRTVSSLQRQIANLQSELIEPQKRHDLLKEEIELQKQANERLKQELHEENAKLKDQNIQMKKMNQQIIALNTRLNEVQANHAKALQEQERERKQLQNIISDKERNLSELRADEVQRAGQLYAAFSKYLGSVSPSPIS